MGAYRFQLEVLTFVFVAKFDCTFCLGWPCARVQPVAQSRETHMASFVIVLAQSLYHFDLVRRRCLSSKLLDKVLREQRQNPNFQQREQQEHRTMDATESLLSAFMEAFVHERSTIPASTPSPSTNGVAVSGAPRGSGIVANFAIRRRLASAFLLAAPNSASTAGACRDFVAALYRGWQLKASRLSRAASSGPAEHDAVGKLLTNEINRTFFCPFLSAATRIKTKEGHAGSVAAPWPLQRQFMLEVSARSLARHLEDPSRWGSVGVESTEKQPKDWSSANAAKQSRVWSAVICSLHRTENKASVQAAASGWREGVHWDRAQFAECVHCFHRFEGRMYHEVRSSHADFAGMVCWQVQTASCSRGPQQRRACFLCWYVPHTVRRLASRGMTCLLIGTCCARWFERSQLAITGC